MLSQFHAELAALAVPEDGVPIDGSTAAVKGVKRGFIQVAGACDQQGQDSARGW